ncbi:MAG: hypothetical protein Q4D02_08170 [Clostridia bacterium]|nr:hypothetical protein [Clostridia bacterium]
MGKLKIKDIIIFDLILVIIGILLLFIYEMYYMSKQAEIVVIPEEYFHVSDVESSDLDIVAKTWVEEYISQYMQKYLNRNKRVVEFNITNITVLDEENKQVSVKFTMKPKVMYSKTFSDWGYMNEEEKIYECEWIMVFESTYKNSGKIWYTTQRMNRAAYELSEYNTSVQAEQDEKYYQFMNQKYYEDLEKECTYKIENGSLYFTYDHSKTWQKIDISGFEDMIDDNTYELDENLYRIGDITYIYYHGKVAVSKDHSKSFQIIECSKINNVMYVYFKDENTGYIISAADFAMGRYAPIVYKTVDGGKKFEEIGIYQSTDWLRRECEIYAFNENLVYIVDPTADGGSSTLMVSTDGFCTFHTVEVPNGTFANELDNESLHFLEIYDTYELPKYQNGKYILIIGQGSDGDYEGGIKAAYESEDGIHWNFIEEFKPTPKPWEG